MKVAYLVNQYPGISHTFVRREIAALERAGLTVRRYAVRPSRQAVIADEDKAEASRTRYILRTPIMQLAGDILASIAAAPISSARAFALAVKLGWRSEAGLARHLVYFAEAAALACWMRREGLAHVHAHFGTNSASVAMLAARIGGAGFSMTVHGPEEFDKPGLIGLPEKIRASRFTAGVSCFGMSQLRRLVGPECWERIKIVRCGVEKTFYEGRETRAPSADQFVCVGRLCEQKGQLTLVEAAALLKERGRRFAITLVGDGEMRGAIEAAIARRGVADRVRIGGWRTPDEVRASIEGARALILPSYAEGLPVSIMEAFSLARPVISTYIAGIPELVIPGENGWLVPAGDAEALANAIAAALDAPDADIRAKGEAGRARVAAQHDIDAIARELKALFAPYEAAA